MMNDRSMMTTAPHHLESEQSVIGALLRSNDALDHIPYLKPEHFYSGEHAAMYAELVRQIVAGKRADVITLWEAMQSKYGNIGPYLNQIAQVMPSAANIARYADVVVDRAIKRGIQALGGDMQRWAATPEEADQIAARAAAQLDELAAKHEQSEPTHLRDLLTEHATLVTKRIEKNPDVMPIPTGFADLDRALGGGLERATVTIIAGRPAMGKTALALAIGRAVGESYGAAGLLSMEMTKQQLMDRNVAALGKLPLGWVKEPTEDAQNWDRLTYAYQRAQDINLFIDDQTALSMVQIRAKARQIKRKAGRLDLLLVDQLSFVTGSERENRAQALGEYTRGFVALAKELDCAVIVLCQLNRKCEERQNKRPMCADLADSGSIEQDASTIVFIYRDEIYAPDSLDRGIAELIIGKARQGSTGTVRLTYIADQTRFESYSSPPREVQPPSKPMGRYKAIAN